MKRWLKWGLWFFVISMVDSILTSFLFDVSIRNSFLSLLVFICILILILPIFLFFMNNIIHAPSFLFIDTPNDGWHFPVISIWGFIFCIIFWTFIGMLIGLIIDKFKSRNEVKKK